MNKLRTILLSLSILTSFSLTATNVSSLTLTDVDGGWNSDSLAKLYFHNSETQRQWAWESISKLSLSGDEKILDFGCGDGKVSADMARLVKNGTVLGIDISEKMIHVARIYFPSYAFPNLQFKNSASITFSDLPGNQDYDLVSSFAVFHLISNPLEVLKNLKTHLKPSGKLLLVVPTGKNPALFQAANEIFQNYGMEAPWNKKDNPNAQSMRTLDGCAFFRKRSWIPYRISRDHGYRQSFLRPGRFHSLDDGHSDSYLANPPLHSAKPFLPMWSTACTSLIPRSLMKKDASVLKCHAFTPWRLRSLCADNEVELPLLS